MNKCEGPELVCSCCAQGIARSSVLLVHSKEEGKGEEISWEKSGGADHIRPCKLW